MTLRDAAVREITSPFPALSMAAGDYVFVMYVVPYAPGGRIASEQVISGCRKDAWHVGEAWEAIPLEYFSTEPLLGLSQQLREVRGDARLPFNDEEHKTILVLNNLI